MCMDVIKDLKNVLAGPEAEQRIKAAISQACEKCPAVDQCKQTLDNYEAQALSYIKSQLNPKKTCQAAGMCPRSAEPVKPPKADSAHFVEEDMPEFDEIVNMESGNPWDEPLPGEPPVKESAPRSSRVEEPASGPVDTAVGNPIECMLCRKVMTRMIKNLKQNRTREAIKHELDGVCDRFAPQSRRDQCEAFVEQYSEEIINALTQDVDAEIACVLLGACLTSPSSSEEEVATEAAILDSETTTQLSDSSAEVESGGRDTEVETRDASQGCYECQMITHFLQAQLNRPADQQAIENYAERELCQRIKHILSRETCDSFIREYGPQMIQLLIQDLDPKVVCEQELQLCPQDSAGGMPSGLDPKLEFEISANASDKCHMCEALVSELDVLLEREGVDREVSSLVSGLCGRYEDDERKRREVSPRFRPLT